MILFTTEFFKVFIAIQNAIPVIVIQTTEGRKDLGYTHLCFPCFALSRFFTSHCSVLNDNILRGTLCTPW